MLSEVRDAKDGPGHGLHVSIEEPVARANAAKDAGARMQWIAKAAVTGEKVRRVHREAREEHRKRIGGFELLNDAGLLADEPRSRLLATGVQCLDAASAPRRAATLRNDSSSSQNVSNGIASSETGNSNPSGVSERTLLPATQKYLSSIDEKNIVSSGNESGSGSGDGADIDLSTGSIPIGRDGGAMRTLLEGGATQPPLPGVAADISVRAYAPAARPFDGL